jgi:hypothetical protein
MNDRGESIKNREYFLKFEAKFETLSDTEQGTWEKSRVKKSRWTVPL